jgi:uncharacterized membrane protein (DUF2068 family)
MTAKKKRSREGILKTIAVLKFIKALLLIAVGLGAFKLLSPGAADQADRWASTLAFRMGPRASSAVHEKLSDLTDSRLVLVGILALLYAALFTVEGVGLWRSKRWAEYLTILATSSFIPFEIYALVRHASWHRVATLAINLLVVGYLIWKVRQREA